MIKTIVGNAIRQYRNKAGYSQETFAKIVGLDRTYISSVEQGKRNISIENLNKISIALDIPAANLFNTSFSIDNILIHIDRESFLLQSIRPLSLDEKDTIDFFCRALLEDYPETNNMDPYEKLLFIMKTLNIKYNIVLLSTPLSQELAIL